MESSINFNTAQLFQVAATLLTGLLSGLFYGYECSVIKGIGNLPDEVYLQSFQSINKVIQNPFFFLSFIGSLLVLPVASWLNYSNGSYATCYLLTSASLVYFIGVFSVTIFCNVPLNEQLANAQLSNATDSEISAIRKVFEKPWNTYHTIRTIASITTFALATLSLIKQKIY